MIVTTTHTIENSTILYYQGLVFGEVIVGINVVREIGAQMRNIFGGRSKGYEKETLKAREGALHQMQEHATRLGANAVVGIKMDYELLAADGSMIMVTCTGTAVTIKQH